MKTLTHLLLVIVVTTIFSTITLAEVPKIISHQGRITVGGTNFTGTGLFKFAFVDSSGVMYWSNAADTNSDGTPDEAVSVTVQDGLYSIILGDSSITGMQAIDPDVFTNSGLYLRVWFNDGTTGWEQLSPDQQIAAAGYAIQAAQLNGKVNTTSDGVLTVDGKLGINTTSPEYKLEIKTSENSRAYFSSSTGTDSEIYNEFIMNTQTTTGYRNYVRFFHGGNPRASFYSESNLENQTATLNLINHTDSSIIFKTNGQNERMRVTGAGRVGILTTSPQTELHVNGVVTATNVITTSDERYKKDIQPIDNALDKVEKLKGVYYNWNRTAFPEKNFPNSRHAGLIAQEVETIVPEAVSTDSEGYKAVNYQSLTPMLIEAIKEQQKLIDQQKRQLEELNKKFDKLNTQLNNTKHN